MPGVKRGKDVHVAWADLLDQKPKRPEGFSTAAEVALKLNCSARYVRDKLRTLRETGKIEAIQVRLNNNLTWVYKDPA